MFMDKRAPGLGVKLWGLGLVGAVALLAACSARSGQPTSKAKELTPGGATTAEPRTSWAGKEAAPEFPGGLTWFNVATPPTVKSLKGKVILLDFWTLGCINCQHIIPDLKRLEAEFGPALAVVGVHSGKYATEHDDDSIREAIRKYGLEHAVVNDPDFVVWKAFGANAWPTLVLIDPAGNLVGGHAGEGVYPLFQPILEQLMVEFEGRIDRSPLPYAAGAQTASTVLSYPSKALPDAAHDRLYIADAGHNRIIVSSLSGRLEKVVGTGKEGFADGRAEESAFRAPQGLALSSDGQTLYVADTRNHAIRAIDTQQWTVTTIAGTGRQLQKLPTTANASARETALASPWDLVEVNGSLYVTMAGVHQIWKMDLAAKTISIFAGTSREGIEDGNRKSMATLAQPSGITTDGEWLFWVDPESSSVRRVPLAGEGGVQTLVGKGLFDYGDVDGPSKEAKLQHPQGIALAGGRLFIGDTYNHKIRAIMAGSGEVATAAGNGQRGWAEGFGPMVEFNEPAGVAVAGNTLYVADQNNHLIRTVDLTNGVTRTLQLSNVAIATTYGTGRITTITLAPQQVAPGGGSIRLQLSTPDGHNLNSQAPSRLTFVSANNAVLEPGDSAITWSSDEPAISLAIPANFNPGSTTLTATGSFYYCRAGEEALCFIQQTEIVVPVTVTAGAPSGEVLVSHRLPIVDAR
jgi:thiol-disulfide isomerase/thioredoxin